MKAYEVIVFLKPTLSEEEITTAKEKIKKAITDLKGEFVEDKEPEKKKLNFEMKKFRDGFQYYVKYNMDSLIVAEFSEKLRLSEEIIRYMISRVVEPKAVKPDKKAAAKAEKAKAEATSEESKPEVSEKEPAAVESSEKTTEA